MEQSLINNNHKLGLANIARVCRTPERHLLKSPRFANLVEAIPGAVSVAKLPV